MGETHFTVSEIILDMDSSVSPTHGDQEGTAYNGHFGCTCYHPLFLFNQFGDLERSSLRPGNVHSADGWRSVLKPVVVRYQGRNPRRYFRGDAAFALPDLYEYLEAEGFLYAIRLPKNPILQESVAHLLTRPVGRPPNHVLRFHASFSYRAGSWDRKRRVVAKVYFYSGPWCVFTPALTFLNPSAGPCDECNSSARHSWFTRRGRLDHADDYIRQHKRTGNHDWRENGGNDPGRS